MTKHITLILLIGCTPTIYVHTETPEEHAVTIRDAGRHLHVRTRVTDNPEGAVNVEFRSSEENVCGEALEKLIGAESPRKALTEGIVDCQPKAWSCPSAIFLAHELGHIFNLKHVDEESNLMNPAPTDVDLDKRQTLTVQGSVILMGEVCPR